MKTARSLLTLVLTSLSLLGPRADAAQIDALARRYRFNSTDIGAIVFDPAQATVLEAHLADIPRIPASTTKIVVALAALHLLGAEYRFTTTLLRDGAIRNGSLHGDVYLRGGGDPSLSSDDLHHFAAALKNAGIRRVTGRFVFDDSFLPSSPAINDRQPVAAAYNPGLSALSLNYNRVQLQWQHTAGRPDFQTRVWSPADSGSLPLGAIQTGPQQPGGDPRMRFLHAAAPLDRWLLSRHLPPHGWETLPVRTDPGRLTALIFRTLCYNNGIALPLPQTGLTPRRARPVYTHASPPLSQLIAGTLRHSNNLSAELIGQVASRRLLGRPVTLHESASALAAWYRQRLPDTDWRMFISRNHSGLSKRSRHTPRQLAAILGYGWRLATSGADFVELLPEKMNRLNQSGGRQDDSPSSDWTKADGHRQESIRAKSGTMHYAAGLAGYLFSRSGRRLGFVILLTDFARRAALDAAFDPRIATDPPEANAWTTRARHFRRALVKVWLERY